MEHFARHALSRLEGGSDVVPSVAVADDPPQFLSLRVVQTDAPAFALQQDDRPLHDGLQKLRHFQLGSDVQGRLVQGHRLLEAALRLSKEPRVLEGHCDLIGQGFHGQQVGLVKGVQLGALDIEHADHLTGQFEGHA